MIEAVNSRAKVLDTFTRFRQTGELPDDVQVGAAVITWAETGVDATKHGDDRRRCFDDPTMNAIREEAVSAVVARMMDRKSLDATNRETGEAWLENLCAVVRDYRETGTRPEDALLCKAVLSATRRATTRPSTATTPK